VAAIAALDPKTGARPWQTRGDGQPHASFIVGAFGRLLVLNEEGELALLMAKAGKCKLLGKVKTCGKTQSQPALADGKLFVCDARTVYCYDLRPPESARSER